MIFKTKNRKKSKKPWLKKSYNFLEGLEFIVDLLWLFSLPFRLIFIIFKAIADFFS
jgi:hypothetical protein